MAGHVACMEENSAYTYFLVGNMKYRDEMEYRGEVGRIILK